MYLMYHLKCFHHSCEISSLYLYTCINGIDLSLIWWDGGEKGSLRARLSWRPGLFNAPDFFTLSDILFGLNRDFRGGSEKNRTFLLPLPLNPDFLLTTWALTPKNALFFCYWKVLESPCSFSGLLLLTTLSDIGLVVMHWEKKMFDQN